MYDRDLVKKLEQEIELTYSNRFEPWRLVCEKVEGLELKDAERPGSDEMPAPRAAAAGAR
jgi:hypothetical protein